MRDSKNSIKETNKLNTIAQYLLIMVVIFITANSLIFITDEFVFIYFVFLTGLFVYKKKKINPVLPYIIIFWILINFFSFIHNKTAFNNYMFIGSIIKLIYPFLLLKIIGPSFFEKLERIIYFLTLISLPIFLLQLIFPNFFISASTYLNIFTKQEFQNLGAWNIGFFNFLPLAQNRNCGFMWEPGAFAFMISIAFVINANTQGFILNNRFVVYLLALISTLSTMGYISLIIIIIMYIIHSKKWITSLLIIPLAILYFQYVIEFDFMAPKINQYISGIDKEYYSDEADYSRVNRFGYFVYAVEQASHWPFGYGIFNSAKSSTGDSLDLNGVGTFSKILIFWGWLGFIFFIFTISKFCRSIQIKKNNLLVLGSTLVIIIAFFSNPFEKSPILFSMIYYPFIFRKISRI